MADTNLTTPTKPVITDKQLSVEPVENAVSYRLYSTRYPHDAAAEYYNGEFTISEDGGDS